MLDLDVLAYIGLHLAHVVAVRTLEPRILTALVTQMTGQVPLPSEHASTVWIRTGVFTGLPIAAPIARPRRGSFVP